MKVREILDAAHSDQDHIHVNGFYKHGLITLYDGKIKILRDILKMNDVLENKNWGGLDPEKCFLLRDVNSISGDSNGLYLSVIMPESYLHVDKNGEILDEFII